MPGSGEYMATMKTPGVYIVEKNAFPSSVVEVATAVPAFIGHTQFADNKGRSLLNKPWRITSAAEYHQYFGGAPSATFSLEEIGPPPAAGAAPAPAEEGPTVSFNGKQYRLKRSTVPYMLYHSMMLFFANGGGPCYIVSVGDYNTPIEANRFTGDGGGISQLIKELEPTMVVIPEAVRLDFDNCTSVQQAMLSHCGEKMKNRIAILDVWQGYKDRKDNAGDPVANFRDALGINFLNFSSAYYPWLNTTIVQDSDLSYESIGNSDVLQGLLTTELTPKDPNSPKAKLQAEALKKITHKKEDWKDAAGAQMDESMIQAEKVLLNKSLIAISPLLNTILREIKEELNLLPPAAAMAGVYTMVDNARGVWKAPANVSLNAVVSPAVAITHDDQEDLNVTTAGKSINAIRSFIGEGTLVWGARTLDGNSLDWRYISVRRTMLMLEESIRLATKAYVFENNTANTWVTIKSMIRNFLTSIWKRGGLAGASPDDAFSVFVGLGETMTPEDILEGILRVTVLVALIRPAEFIEITFQQQMQKS
jgi:phage tail sheath protein FI